MSPFSSEYVRRLNEVAHWAFRLQEMEQQLAVTIAQAEEAYRVNVPPPMLMGMIYANTLVTGWVKRWEYSVVQVYVDAAGTIQTVTDGFNGLGYNMREFAHTPPEAPEYVWDVKVLGSASYPAGFAGRPIGGGGTDDTHKRNTIVWGQLRRIEDLDETVFLFDAMGSHDGTCEAPPP